MIEINLLPKDYLKSQRAFSFGKSGIYAAVAGIGLAAVLACLTFYQMHRITQLEENIDRANQRAAMLQQDITLVDGLTEVKDKITRRMNAVEQLDRHRTAWVRILENVAGNVPEFVWLASFKEKKQVVAEPQQKTSSLAGPMPGDAAKKQNAIQTQPAPQPISTSGPKVMPVEIEGYAFTLNALAAFMIKMMRSDYFENVELVSSSETKFAEDDRAYQFVVSCELHYLSDEELRNLFASSDNAPGLDNEEN